MKKNTHVLSWVNVFLVAFAFAAPAAVGAEGDEASIEATVTPARYIWIKGDEAKFRAMNWMSGDYSGGVKDLSGQYKFKNGATMSFSGHALSGDDDAGGSFLFNKEDLGEISVDYETFTKYYDNTGGFYLPFTTLQSNDLSSDDLNMDIGHLLIAVTPKLENFHDVTLAYERHRKEGNKSRLTWGAVKEGGVTRNIAPSSQEIDETTDTFSAEGKTTLLGFDVTGKQIIETADITSVRTERNLSDTSTPSDTKVRQQIQEPSIKSVATLLHGEKWFREDQSFLGMGYSYRKIKNEELENIIESDKNGVPLNFSSAKTRVNATAVNRYDSNAMASNYVHNFSPAFQVTTKLKTGYTYRRGDSTYPYDASPSNSSNGAAPDGVIEATDYSQVKNSVLNFGQDIGFRYTGLTHLALYGDVETEQVHNNIRERQQNISNVLQWERDTIAFRNKAAATVGGRYTPMKQFNVTTQVRHKIEDNNYDDKADTSGSINSAFFESLDITGDEFSTRFNWIPVQRFQAGFRYQFLNNVYQARIQDFTQQAKSRMLSHIFTYDASYQPTDKLFLTGAFSRQLAKTSTPISGDPTTPLPGFNSGFNTVMTGASYAVSQRLGYNANANYTWADNFNNFTSSGLPLGVSNRYYNVELGMWLKPTDKDFSLEPHYAYYSYASDDDAETGDYSAHVVWLDCNLQW